MANSELYVQDSNNNNQWKPLTTDILLDNETFGHSYKYSEADEVIVAGEVFLFALHLTVTGATVNDTVTIKDGANTILKFTMDGSAVQTFSFCPTVSIYSTGTLSVESDLTQTDPPADPPARFNLTTVYN